MTITHSTITGNTASIAAAGGVPIRAGVNSSSGRLDLVDSTVSGNNAIGGSVSRGGGIASFNTVTTLTRTTVSGNAASVSSGGSVGVAGAGYSVQAPSRSSTARSPATLPRAHSGRLGGLKPATIATATNTTQSRAMSRLGRPVQGGNVLVDNESDVRAPEHDRRQRHRRQSQIVRSKRNPQRARGA